MLQTAYVVVVAVGDVVVGGGDGGVAEHSGSHQCIQLYIDKCVPEGERIACKL